LLQIQLESPQLKRSTINIRTEKRIANALQADQCEEKQFFTEDLIRSVTFTAAEDEPRERLNSIASAGYDPFVVQLLPGHEGAIEDWARLFDKA
jgi:hypothetical protein